MVHAYLQGVVSDLNEKEDYRLQCADEIIELTISEVDQSYGSPKEEKKKQKKKQQKQMKWKESNQYLIWLCENGSY